MDASEINVGRNAAGTTKRSEKNARGRQMLTQVLLGQNRLLQGNGATYLRGIGQNLSLAMGVGNPMGPEEVSAGKAEEKMFKKVGKSPHTENASHGEPKSMQEVRQPTAPSSHKLEKRSGHIIEAIKKGTVDVKI